MISNYSTMGQYSLVLFQSGLNRKIISDASNCNANDISNYCLKYNIQTDFKANNIIAYCCFKSIEYIRNINKSLHLNFLLPNQIIVEDFNNLKGNLNDSWGVCNLLPTKLYKNSDKIIPERTILFNSNLMEFNDKRLLEYMNDVAEFQKKENIESSSHFLIKFVHEFAHSLHEGYLQQKFSANKLNKIIHNFLDKNNILVFQKKYSDLITNNICRYASENPFESIACDLSKRILDKNNQSFKPYKKYFFLKSVLCKDEQKNDNQFNKLINEIWNGKIF